MVMIFDGFVVTDNMDYMLLGKPVTKFGNIYHNCDDCGFVLALNEKNTGEVEQYMKSFVNVKWIDAGQYSLWY